MRAQIISHSLQNINVTTHKILNNSRNLYNLFVLNKFQVKISTILFDKFMILYTAITII